MARSPATLKDVAARVGVHPSTVSRVLNPKTRDMVSPDVAEKIQRVANEMGYRVNPFALGLKTKKSFTVGVLIPDLTNPGFPPMIRGIEKALGRAGYTAILGDSDNHLGEERVIIDRMKARQVDGLILATAHRTDELIAEYVEDGLPLVLINRSVDDNSVPSITNDDARGIHMAVDHVVELGHKTIAHVAGPQSLSTGHERYVAFIDAMARHGLEADPDLVTVCGTFSEEEGCKAFKKLHARDKNFTAVVASNDLLALGCYDAMEELGLTCPDDVSVTGFNDMPFVDKFKPPLTTVRIALTEMGVKAAETLLKVMNSRDEEIGSIKLNPEFIVRGSTAPSKG